MMTANNPHSVKIAKKKKKTLEYKKLLWLALTFLADRAAATPVAKTLRSSRSSFLIFATCGQDQQRTEILIFSQRTTHETKAVHIRPT